MVHFMLFLIFRIFGGKSFFVAQTVLYNVNFALNLINISDKTLIFVLQERDYRNLGKDRKDRKQSPLKNVLFLFFLFFL